MSKRKARTANNRNNTRDLAQSRPYEPDPSLFIQAHEADIVRGPQAHVAALALEVATVNGRIMPGDGLIRWNTSLDVPRDSEDDEQDEQGEKDSDRNAIWVDRYDARLLLDVLPTFPTTTEGERMSPTGWSDLPSDTEDTFFLSPDEVEDYQRDKRRRLIERGREERLRAMREEQNEDEPNKRPEDDWGGSDEEPDEKQKELMRRTATHILSSPNPAQLEMRILANHGADARFAFLRGRWSRAWKITKGRTRLEAEAQKKRKEEEKQKVVLGGLSGYGDSDDNEDSADDEGGPQEPEHRPPPSPKAGTAQADVENSNAADEAAKEARRARAKEWAERRRAAMARDTPSTG